MPLYEYECKQCKRRTEKIQKFSDAPLTECPHCGGHMERLVHAPAVSFKGGGWYADLYSSSSKSSTAADTKNGSGTASSSSTDSSSTSSSSTASTPAPSSAPTAPASPTSSDKK